MTWLKIKTGAGLPASTPNRFILTVLSTIACFAAFAACSVTHSDAEPPGEVVVQDACPFEGCQYGDWTAGEEIPLYDQPGNDSEPATTLRPGQKIVAVTGEIRAAPRRAIVTAGYEGHDFPVGTVVYALYPAGEGTVAVWHEGEVRNGSLDLQLRYDPPVPEGSALQWAWWVEIRLPDGTTGWVKNPQNHAFEGMDRHS